MPEIIHGDAWATSLRQQVRALARGWTVEEARNRIRLKVRVEGSPTESVTLSMPWAAASAGDAYVRIRNIYAQVEQGHSVKQAADIAAGKAPKLTAQRDWAGAADAFRTQKLEHGTTVKPTTYAATYEPVVTTAVELLTGRNAPGSAADLMDACIRKWKPGSRMRQIRAQSLAQFLRFCVDRKGFPALWAPPADLKQHVGIKATTAATFGGDPFTDQQILNLLASLPEDSSGQRWADAIRLLAELGLRPGELLHLQVKTDPATGEPFWWCSYRKRSGGGATEPRRVHPLRLVDDQGEVQRWNLLLRWQAGLIELPPLTSGNGAGDGMRTYLNRQQGWRALRAELAAKGENAVPYSFRHSYSLRGHQRGIDAGSVALSMGHSFEVHCRAYPWASKAGATAAFERAEAALVSR